ncbi:MAG TPA: NADP-dependent malic enzyme [Thermoplasmatales archaeon]|nr:NADP-dependent malic enzyme [Thermoplasmatales archaeon]
MEEKTTVQELLKKTKKPAQEAMRLHPFYKGKVQILPKCPIRNFDDFSIWYTPGVAEPCKDIAKNPDKVFEHTNKANFVAVVSDGTRVLGLGDIGPLAGLPVMEGKALLFKYLGGVDAFPVMIDTKDPDDFIQAVKWIAPTFGGINLEDISSPKCFYILDKLRKEMNIPVWHDDQQGTAAITLAGVINGLKVVGKKLNEVLYTIIGTGAANVCMIRTLVKAGVPYRNIIAVDSKGILHPEREDIELLEEKNPYKYEIAMKSNGEGRRGGMAEALKEVDVCIAASKPGPGTIKKEWVENMNNNAIMFAEANPIPEIWPWEAKEAGVKVFGTGRSDFPNQVNNSLGFPGIFRGTLDVMAKTITDEMHIAAAYAIAEVAEQKGLSEEYIVPTMDDWEVFPHEAAAVGVKAIEQGIARKKMSRTEIYENAEHIIRSAREETQMLMKKGFIAEP